MAHNLLGKPAIIYDLDIRLSIVFKGCIFSLYQTLWLAKLLILIIPEAVWHYWKFQHQNSKVKIVANCGIPCWWNCFCTSRTKQVWDSHLESEWGEGEIHVHYGPRLSHQQRVGIYKAVFVFFLWFKHVWQPSELTIPFTHLLNGQLGLTSWVEHTH